MRFTKDQITVSIVETNFTASLNPMADVAYKPWDGTYFHTVFDKVTWVLILMNLREIEAISESHFACLVDIVSESLVAHS